MDEWLHVSPPADSSPVMLRGEGGAHLVLEYRQVLLLLALTCAVGCSILALLNHGGMAVQGQLQWQHSSS